MKKFDYEVKRPNVETLLAAAQGDRSTGFCLACGNEQGNCEPDTRDRVCESCRYPAVYGAEELIVMGFGGVPEEKAAKPKSPRKLNAGLSVEFTTDIAAVTDACSSRYLCHCVQALPEAKGDGLLVATNGKILAIVPAKVEGNAPSMIPPEALPTLEKHWKLAGCAKPKALLQDGRWGSSSLAERVDSPEGRFPRCSQQIPAAVPTNKIELAINAEYLLDLAKAITDKGERPVVRFVIDVDDLDKPYIVTGSTGVGVIMPCAIQAGHEDIGAERYTEIVERLVKAEKKHFGQGSNSIEFGDVKKTEAT